MRPMRLEPISKIPTKRAGDKTVALEAAGRKPPEGLAALTRSRVLATAEKSWTLFSAIIGRFSPENERPGRFGAAQPGVFLRWVLAILSILVLPLLLSSGIGDTFFNSRAWAVEQAGRPDVSMEMKGWLLFSWHEGNKWYFSLLPGTNRSRHWSEVNLAKVTGWDALRLRLENLSPGEDLTYGESAHVEDANRGLPKLSEPPRPIQRKLSAFVTGHGLKFLKTVP